MKTNAERNAELRKPIEGLLKYMAKRLEDGLNIGEDGPIYEDNIYLGFGNDAVQCRAKFYVCPESYEILEEACNKIIDFIDAEYPASDPIGKLVKSYEIVYTGGGIWCVYGWMNNGMWFCGETPDQGTSLMMYNLTDEQKNELKEDWADATNDITCEEPNEEYMPNNSKWLLAWTEILDDYAKNGEHSAELEHWRYEMLEEVAK